MKVRLIIIVFMMMFVDMNIIYGDNFFIVGVILVFGFVVIVVVGGDEVEGVFIIGVVGVNVVGVVVGVGLVVGD